MGLDSSSSINLAYLKLPRWRTRCRFSTLILLKFFSGSFFLTENRAQNNIEYHQRLLSYALGNEAKRNADE